MRKEDIIELIPGLTEEEAEAIIKLFNEQLEKEKESVAAIRAAKAEGLNITAETAPHYLLLDDTYLEEDGRFKMNPPLRSEADRLALIEGIKDGTIDMIATDHAPHSAEEKSKGLEKSAFGIVGIETAFPVMYTFLVKTGIITLEKLIELLSINPRKRFGIENGNACIFSVAADSKSVITLDGYVEACLAENKFGIAVQSGN